MAREQEGFLGCRWPRGSHLWSSTTKVRPRLMRCLELMLSLNSSSFSCLCGYRNTHVGEIL